MATYKEQVKAFEERMRSIDGQTRFFDLARFPWVQDVEAHWREVRAECDGMFRALDLLPGYEDIQIESLELSDDGRWKIVPFWAYGRALHDNLRRCPHTAAALALIPGLRSAMFSILLPGKVLPRHRGPYAGVLRHHLAVTVPEPALCGIEVGGDERAWVEGRSLVFDDTHMHRAWNHGSQTRVVLFTDFDRPLAPPLDAYNREIIRRMGDSPFIVDAMERWRQWEALYGARVDALLAGRG